MTHPTNSIDSELEDVPKLENDDMYILQNIITDYVTISGDELFDLAQAIKSKYISRKEVEKAIVATHHNCEGELQPASITWAKEHKILINGWNARGDQLRAKLLPPTNGGNDEPIPNL